MICERLPSGSYEEILKNGIVLCKLMQRIQPNSIARINTFGGQFKFMENLIFFRNACKQLGLTERDLFHSVDLYERRNIPAVTQCILALGRRCSTLANYSGPQLAPRAEQHWLAAAQTDQENSRLAMVQRQRATSGSPAAGPLGEVAQQLANTNTTNTSTLATSSGSGQQELAVARQQGGRIEGLASQTSW